MSLGIIIFASLTTFGLLYFGEKIRCDFPKSDCREQVLVDYNFYSLSKGEWLFYFFLAAFCCFFVIYLFYRSFFLACLALPAAIFYPGHRAKIIMVERKKALSLQFKEALYALASSLLAGRSVESAFQQALQDLTLLYPDPQTDIIREFTYIVRCLEMNEPIETVLFDFAQRAHLEDLTNFVDVFVISKRSGGNLVEIMRNTSTLIGDKLQIEQEIETLLAKRKLEQKILNLMPVVMLFLLSISMGDYMVPVFTTLAGRCLMTVAVILLLFAVYLNHKIMFIEV